MKAIGTRNPVGQNVSYTQVQLGCHRGLHAGREDPNGVGSSVFGVGVWGSGAAHSSGLRGVLASGFRACSVFGQGVLALKPLNPKPLNPKP